MTIYLKQSTASQEVLIGPFVDTADGFTAKTALTIANTDIKIWKAGATTLASKNSGGATHVSTGNYYAVFDATDTDTLGSGRIIVQVSGALPVFMDFVVLAANIYDSLIGGGDILDVSMTQYLGNAVPAADTAGYPKVTVKSGTGTGEVSLAAGLVRLSATGVADILTTALVEAYRADGATGTLTQLLYELIAHLGEASISGTTLTLKKVDGSTTAATFTLNDATTPTSVTRTS